MRRLSLADIAYLANVSAKIAFETFDTYSDINVAIPANMVDGSGWATATSIQFGNLSVQAIEDYQSYADIDPTTDFNMIGGTGWATTTSIQRGNLSLQAKDDFDAYSVTGGLFPEIPNINGGTGWATAPLLGKVKPPVFTPDFGTPTLSVSLSTPLFTAASIYYTTNGSTPTTGSTLYTGAISITSSTTLKAIAVQTGYANSDVATRDYPTIFPNNITGLVLWLKADAITGKVDNDAISTWLDSSSAANNATQPTGGKQGLYKTGIQNGLPVVRFDATDDGMVTTLNLAKPLTVFVVYSHRGIGVAGRRAVQGHTTNWLLGPYSGKYEMFNNSFVPGGLIETQYIFVVQTARQVLNFAEHWVNQVLRGTNTDNNAPGIFSLAADGTAGTSFPEPLDGDIAEVVAYNVALSDADRDKVWQYLHAKWAI